MQNDKEVISINTEHIELPQREFDLFQNRACVYDNMFKGQEVAVCVIAFNRLEKTKRCVESILEYTRNISYQLVLLDNGSTDGTLEYFKNIDYPDKTIYHIEKNIGAMYAGIVLMQMVQSKYIAIVANDCIVTSNWLNNLVTCMESDRQIGMVCPAASNVSNLQSVSIGEYNSMEQMQKLAAEYNKSNPLLWEERARLIPVLAVYRKEMLDLIGVVDPGFYHEYSDDEFSVRIRRGGYKMVLCLDTFIEHNHLIQERNIEQENISTGSGFENFQKKFGNINPLSDIQNFIYMYLTNMSLCKEKELCVNVLGIDVGCGTPILDVKNRIRKDGYFKSYIKTFTSEIKYYTDLSYISNEVVHNEITNLMKFYRQGEFQIIVAGKEINYYEKPLEFVGTMVELLEKDGYLLFSLKNNLDITKLLRIINWERIEGIDYSVNIEYEDVLNTLEQLGISNVWIYDEPFNLVNRETLSMAGDVIIKSLADIINGNEEDIKRRLQTRIYWFLIKK